MLYVCLISCVQYTNFHFILACFYCLSVYIVLSVCLLFCFYGTRVWNKMHSFIHLLSWECWLLVILYIDQYCTILRLCTCRARKRSTTFVQSAKIPELMSRTFPGIFPSCHPMSFFLVSSKWNLSSRVFFESRPRVSSSGRTMMSVNFSQSCYFWVFLVFLEIVFYLLEQNKTCLSVHASQDSVVPKWLIITPGL